MLPNNHLFNYLFLLFKFIKITILSLKYDYIYALGVNTIYTLIGGIILNKKIIYHCNEIPSFISKNRSIKKSVDRWLFNKIKYIVVSNKYRRDILKKYSAGFQKYFILENILELKYYDYPKNPLVNKSKYDRITLVYSGLINSNRMILELLNTIENHPVFDLILVGPISNNNDELIEKINKTKNFSYRGVLPNLEVLNIIKNECDCGIAFYSMKSLNNKYCAPLKIHEYFQFNKFVITFKNPPLMEIERNYNIIHTIDSIDSLCENTEVNKIRNRLKCLTTNDFMCFLNDSKFLFETEINKISDEFS